jgi:hypothetical protein
MFSKLARLCGYMAFLLMVVVRVAADDQVRVPPADELVVIDPNVDSRNLPVPIFVPNGEGNKGIEIPPVVIVHRYYYTGDRDFQGPMLPGGPTVFVVHHPRTGEQVSVQGMLMPGSPRIRYTKTCVVYEYTDRRISLDFGVCGDAEPRLVIQQDDPVTDRIQSGVREVRQTTSEFVTASGLTEAAAGLRKRSREAFVGVGQQLNTAGNAVFGRAGRLWDSTVAGGLTKPSARFQPKSLLNEAPPTKGLDLEGTVPTNR